MFVNSGVVDSGGRLEEWQSIAMRLLRVGIIVLFGSGLDVGLDDD